MVPICLPQKISLLSSNCMKVSCDIQLKCGTNLQLQMLFTGKFSTATIDQLDSAILVMAMFSVCPTEL